MVDSLMGANTQMYYLNGRIDYTGIVTQPPHTDPLYPGLLLLLLSQRDKTGKVIMR